MIQNMNQTLNQPFGDGAHILYVNGEYRDDSAIGKLMHDLHCKKADEMHSPILAKRVYELKETEKEAFSGVKKMEESGKD